jgi:hypothetical protein
MLKSNAFHHGPHPSASYQFPDFILQDMQGYINMGYWVVLPFSDVQHLPLLKLAPSGVVPQCDRQPLPIMDYSYNYVNQTSLPIAPFTAMQRIAYCNPQFCPPLLAKLDLADGYYRIPLAPAAALQLSDVLPPDGGDNLISIPLSLPMGCSHSPPYFCAFTETAADIINTQVAQSLHLPHHPFYTLHTRSRKTVIFQCTPNCLGKRYHQIHHFNMQMSI